MTMTTLLHQLQQTQPDAVQTLLDDLVHDIHEAIALDTCPHCPDTQTDDHDAYLDAQSLLASDINNAGHDAQIRFLTEANAAERLHLALIELDQATQGEAL